MKVAFAPDFQNLWPEHSAEELAQLEQNCLADPNHERMPPIAVWANHKNTVVEGHHQLAIREKHRLKIKYTKLEFETRDHAKAFALAAQLGRRNLNESQLAMAIAEVYKYRRYAHGGNRKAVQGASVSLAKLAETAGISTRTMKSAAKVSDKAAPSIVDGVKAGIHSVSDATAVADRPKKEQAKIATKAKREGKTLAASAEKPAVDPNSLEAVQADLHELEKQIRACARRAREVLGMEGDEFKRPWCGLYSKMTLIHPLEHVARTIKNDMPVGGTSKTPILFHEEKARSLAT